MFSHRRRASTGIHLPKHHHQPQAPPSSTAATAATTAFLNRKNPDATLSAAAAATALRSHPASPTSVSSVQTKRIQQKSSSGSLQRARSASPHRAPLLERSPSNASLSERTLRRNSSPGRGVDSTSAQVPPVPAIPAEITGPPATTRQRASSLETPTRTYSPMVKSDQRNASLDGRSRHSGQATRSRAQRLPQVEELSRENSKRSVNFSRPMSPPNANHSSAFYPSGKAGWHSGPIVTGNVPRHDPPSIRSALAAPTPQSHAAGAAEFLAPSYVSAQSAIAPPPHIPASQLISGGLTTSKWSTGQKEDTNPSSNQRIIEGGISNSVPGPTQPAEHKATMPAPVQPAPTIAKNISSSSYAETEKDAQPRHIVQETHEPLQKASVSTLIPEKRRQTPSPARAAHFDGSGSMIINGIKHDPPGRTASPAKSALKMAHPDHTTATKVQLSAPEPPESSIPTVEPKRKKTVRINLEVVPGEETHGLKSSRYAPPTPIKPHSNFEKDLDNISQPRPALPAFESIRGQSRDHTESSSDHKIGFLLHGLKHNQPSTIDGTENSALARSSLLAGKGARREDIEQRAVETPKDGLSSGEADSAVTSESISEPSQIRQTNPPGPSQISKNEKEIRTPQIRPVTPQIETRDWAVPGAFPDTHAEDELSFTAGNTGAGSSATQVDTTPSLREPEDSSDDESVYEDAAEELEEGFASLNTILEESTPDDISKVSKAIITEPVYPLVSQGSVDTLALETRLEEARINSRDQAQPDIQNESRDSSVLPVSQPRRESPKSRKGQGNSSSPKPEKYLRTSKWSPSNAPTGSGQDLKTSHTTQGSTQAQTGRPPSPPQSKAFFGVPILKRTSSADSVSSFKRNRASSPRDKNRFSLRQSLRGTNSPELAATSTHTRHGSIMRPQSPESISSHKMRSSLRNDLPPRSFSNDESSFQRAKSPSRLSSFLRYKPKFGKSEKQKPKVVQEDGDDELPRKEFVSRFADSDDELESPRLQPPIEFAPVRGIPQRRGADDSDSTDLEDSGRESPQEMLPVPSLADVQKAHDTPVKTDSKESPGPGTIDSGLASSKYAPKAPAGHKRWHSFLHLGQHKSVTQDDSTPTSPAMTGSDASPKPGNRLRKAHPKSRHQGAGEEIWPLGNLPPPRFEPLNDERPFSADGPKQELNRIDMGQRRNTADEILLGRFQKEVGDMQDSELKEIQINGVNNVPNQPNDQETIASDKDRKKRFSKFRRMIGMKK